MKSYWGVQVKLHAFLTSPLDGSECLASRPGRFTPENRAPGTHWIGEWAVPRLDLDAATKSKIPFSVGNLTPVVQPVA
jgi:hypothetical protein